MARSRLRLPRLSLPTLSAGVIVVLLIIGGLIWYRPFLTRYQQPVASVPAPPALFSATQFSVPGGGSACMKSVTVTPQSGVAGFVLRPGKASAHGGPPVEVILLAPGYRSTAQIAGGYPGGTAMVPITPPRRPLIATVCFIDRGKVPILLNGTIEPRTVSRSPLLINGQTVVGDVALTFYEPRPNSLIHRLGEIFKHASNLTDGFVPVWGVWLIAILTAFGFPICVIAAFHVALREDVAGGRVLSG